MATERFQLVIDNQVTGQQKIQELNQSLAGTGRELSTLSRQAEGYRATLERALTSTGKVVIELSGAALAAKSLTSAVSSLGTVMAAHVADGEKVIRTYQGVRLGIAGIRAALAGSWTPLLTTTGALGIGVLAERTVALVAAQAKLTEQNALLAARTGLSTKEVATLGSVSVATGRDAGFLLKSVQALNEQLSAGDTTELNGALRAVGVSARELLTADAPGRLRLVAEGLDKIVDPAERAKAAMTLFGKDVGTTFFDLNTATTTNLRRAEQWGLGLSDVAEKYVTKFRRDLLLAKSNVDAFTSSVNLAIERGKQLTIEAITPRPNGIGTFGGQASTINFDRTGNALFPGSLDIDAARKQVAARSIGGAFSLMQTNILAATMRDEQALRDSQAKYANSVRGLEQKRAEYVQRKARLESDLEADRNGGKPLDDVARALTRSALVTLDSGIEELDKRVESARQAMDRARSLQQMIEKLQPGQYVIDNAFPNVVTGVPMQTPRAPSLLRGAARYAPTGLGTFSIDPAEYERANAGAGSAAAQQALARLSGQNQLDDLYRNRALNASRLLTEYQVRRVELLAAPGGEISALKEAANLRMAAVEAQREIIGGYEVEQQKLAIQRDLQLQILQARRQQRQEGRNTFTSLFDAGVAGGQGLRSFATSAALAIPRTMAGNLGEMFGGLTGRFTLPGATSTNMLGKLLAGTPFGVDPMKAAGDVQMTAAKIQLEAATINAGRGASGGTIGNVINGASGLLSFGKGSSTPGITVTDALGLTMPTLNANGTVSNPSRYAGLTKGLGAGAALAAGAFGAYSGFSAGGAQGALTGAASIAGSVGAVLPMISKSLAMAGPIGAVAGIALGLGAMFLGDPKAKRRSDLESEASSRRFTEPTGADYVQDIYGRGVGYDYRGDLRPIVVNNHNETNNINAVDAQSFVEWGKRNPDAIASVTSNAIMSGNADDLVGSIRVAMAS